MCTSTIYLSIYIYLYLSIYINILVGSSAPWMHARLVSGCRVFFFSCVVAVKKALNFEYNDRRKKIIPNKVQTKYS